LQLKTENDFFKKDCKSYLKAPQPNVAAAVSDPEA